MEISNLKENRKVFSKIGLSFFIGTIIIYAAQYAMIWLFDSFIDEKYSDYQFLVSMIPMYAIFFPLMAFLLGKIKVEKPVEKNKLSFKAMFTFFMISYAAMYISNLGGNVIARIIEAFKKSAVENSILEIATSNSLWINMIVMVICAPIMEELLFRKFIIDRTIQFGEKTAIILSGLMFGFFHGNLYQFCYAFALGVIFGYVYVKSGQVKYTIILHMIINFMGGILGVIMLKATGMMQILELANDPNAMTNALMQNVAGLLVFFAYAIMLVAIVITGVVLFFVNLKKINLKQAEVQIAKGEGFKTIVLNLGMLLFFLTWTGLIIYHTVA